MGLFNPFRRKDDDFTARMMREADAARPPSTRPARPVAQPTQASVTRSSAAQSSAAQSHAAQSHTARGHSGQGFSGSGIAGNGAAGDDLARSALADAVVTQVRAGNKIEAIKLYRFATGAGLNDSRRAVEAIAAGGMPTASVAPSPSTSSVQPGATDAEVLHLVQAGKLIEAIKEYRVLHGVGFAEAKDAVDGMVAR